MAVGAFQFGRCYMPLMAESNRIRSFGGKLDVASTHLFLLGKSDPQNDKRGYAYTDNRDLPNFLPQFSTSFFLKDQKFPLNSPYGKHDFFKKQFNLRWKYPSRRKIHPISVVEIL